MPAFTVCLNSSFRFFITFARNLGFTRSTSRLALPLAIFAVRLAVAGLPFFSRP